MKPLNTIILSIPLILSLAACASSPESDPDYVSPTHYSNFNCNQIRAEKQRVFSKLEQAKTSDTTGQVLDTAVSIFAISQGYGFGGKEDKTYQRLNNQYEVLEQESIRKECGFKEKAAS